MYGYSSSPPVDSNRITPILASKCMGPGQNNEENMGSTGKNVSLANPFTTNMAPTFTSAKGNGSSNPLNPSPPLPATATKQFFA